MNYYVHKGRLADGLENGKKFFIKKIIFFVDTVSCWCQSPLVKWTAKPNFLSPKPGLRLGSLRSNAATSQRREDSKDTMNKETAELILSRLNSIKPREWTPSIFACACRSEFGGLDEMTAEDVAAPDFTLEFQMEQHKTFSGKDENAAFFEMQDILREAEAVLTPFSATLKKSGDGNGSVGQITSFEVEFLAGEPSQDGESIITGTPRPS